MDPLLADGALAFLAAFGAFPAIIGAATGAITGTATGIMIGTAIGTALPEVAGATDCPAATAMRASRKNRDLNILLVCVIAAVVVCELQRI